MLFLHAIGDEYDILNSLSTQFYAPDITSAC